MGALVSTSSPAGQRVVGKFERAVGRLEGLIEKSRGAPDPTGKVGYLASAQGLFRGLEALDGDTLHIDDTRPTRALLEALEAEYRAEGLYDRPEVAAHLRRIEGIQSRKLHGLRRPARRGGLK